MGVQTVLVGWACTTLCLVSYTAAFSHGASLSACADMTPKHIRAQLQNPRNNYIAIHTNMSSYFPGDKVPVTVRSTRDFMGFLLQARRVSNDQIAGTFVVIPPGSKLLTCFEDGDTVTHSDKSLKRNLSFVWKAPDHPIGDIKFFLSVVQSYFVYWARIESTVTSFTLYAKFVPGRVTRMAVTKILETVFGGKQDAELLGNDRQLSEPPMESAALSVSHSHGGRQVNRSKTFEVQGLEPSLELQELDMANALRSFILQDYTSSHITHDGYCVNIGYNIFNVGTITFQNAMEGVNDLDASSSLSSASRQMVERKSVAQETLANFLPHSEDAESREEDDNIGEIARNPLPLVTRPVPKAAVPGKGEHPTRGTQLVAAQLGILLGCTAALGMALAAGLRCIHSQYCHKRTEVSFSEPDNNVITVRENGEMMHFRKIRENSFVLVQAEYNWISPSGSGKKSVI
uniref:Reeler domain containing 1 n=1 Tax=Crocodylus porosus TaxID=8502 RepID=A0A7M4EN06_CROPO